ncbi:MAG: hypothetical protein U5Q16_02160 [Gammaproteobacteria bacterium]|nr:hypothetical protein [Gammaproteobacteria bacterium]
MTVPVDFKNGGISDMTLCGPADGIWRCLAFTALLLAYGCGDDGSAERAGDRDPDGSAARSDRRANFNWSDYIDDQTIPAFEAASGIEVRYDVYDSNDVLEGKLLAGNTGYDIVVPTGNFFEVQRKAGLFRPLNKDALTNYGNLDPAILAKIEPLTGNRVCGVPYAGHQWPGINLDAVETGSNWPPFLDLPSTRNMPPDWPTAASPCSTPPTRSTRSP